MITARQVLNKYKNIYSRTQLFFGIRRIMKIRCWSKTRNPAH